MLKSDCEITWLEEVNIINIFKIIIIAVILITIISIININIFMIIIILITIILIIYINIFMIISILLLREHTRVVAKSREAEEKAAKLEEELREVKTIIIIITTYIFKKRDGAIESISVDLQKRPCQHRQHWTKVPFV